MEQTEADAPQDAAAVEAAGQGAAATPESAEASFQVAGDASADELAALTVVLAALGGGESPEPPSRAGGWGGAGTGVRRVPAAGPGAWRASALPR